VEVEADCEDEIDADSELLELVVPDGVADSLAD